MTATEQSTAAAWPARADDLAEWAMLRLVNRTDRYGGQARDRETGAWSRFTYPAKGPVPGCVGHRLLARHFRAADGRDVIGLHALGPDSSGKWVGIDWDSHGDGADPGANLAFSLGLYGELAGYGFRPLLNESDGKGGYHLRALFDGAVPGDALYAFGNWLVRDFKRYGLAKPPEVFPKQPRLTETTQYGNWLRLVGRHHKRGVWPRVFDGSAWLDGEGAVGHVLSLTGDPVSLIPAAALRAAEAKEEKPPKKNAGNATDPGDDVFAAFNGKQTMDSMTAMLERHGWSRCGRQSQEQRDFTRPGKDAGVSGNLKVIDGVPIFYGFSTSTDVPPDRGLNPSQLRAHLECTGSFALLAERLQDEGYGPKRVKATLKIDGKPATKGKPADEAAEPTADPDGPRDDTGAAPPSAFTDTDVANGRRFVRDHEPAVRFVVDWKHWMVFDGRRWVPDRAEVLAESLAKETTDRMAAEAAKELAAAAKELAASATDEEKEAAGRRVKAAGRDLAHAKRSQDMRAVRRMLAAARSEPAVRVPFGRDVFDAHPHLLNAANGTVDLRTGEMHPHRREDFLTRVCPVPFDREARCDGYLAFLAKVFHKSEKDGKNEMVSYVRRLGGYVATGEVCDHSFHVWHGEGGNGKSVLEALWTHVLGEGEYAHTAPAELLVNDGRDRHPTEKVGLRGARLVMCSESAEDGRLDEAKVKKLTSNDMITARGMGQDFFQFHPTHKLVLATNHKPRLRGTDDGIRRRLRLVPFVARFWKEADRKLNPTGTFDEAFKADPGLEDRLKATESAGILADMVRYAVVFYRNGKTLVPPGEVTSATAEYLKAEDLIAQFFDARCTPDPDKKVKAAEFFKIFKQWATDEGHDEKRLPGVKKFGTEAKKRFASTTPHSVVYQVSVLNAA